MLHYITLYYIIIHPLNTYLYYVMLCYITVQYSTVQYSILYFKHLIKKRVKIPLEMPGIEPGAFHMRSKRSTTELHPLLKNNVNKYSFNKRETTNPHKQVTLHTDLFLNGYS